MVPGQDSGGSGCDGGGCRRRGRDAAWTWTTSDGTELRGAAGDWEVTDDDGASRSVAAAVFEQTHEHVADDRWRRVGEVDARPARAGEVVHTLEGDLTARPGQWLVRGVAGEEWLVPEAHLASSYARVDRLDRPVEQEEPA